MSFYDRPRLAAANILRGDLQGFARSLFSPESLSGLQNRDLVAEMGLEKSAAAGILRVITDPLFLIGTALHVKMPTGSAQSIEKFAKKVSMAEKKLGILGETFGSMWRNFAGTGVDTGALRHSGATVRWVEDFFGRLGPAMDKVRQEAKLLGQKVPDKMAKIGAVADGWNQRGSVRVPTFRKTLRLTRKIDLTSAEQEMLDTMTEVRTKIKKRYEGRLEDPEVVSRIQADFAKQGLDPQVINFMEGDFFPHVEGNIAAVARQNLLNLSERQITNKYTLPTAKRVAKNLKMRKGSMNPALADLERLANAGYLNTEDVAALRDLYSKAGLNIRQYTLQPAIAYEKYVRRMGQTYSWHIEGNGKLITDALEKFKNPDSSWFDPVKAHLLETKYLPMMTQQMTPAQMRRVDTFASKVEKAYNALGKGTKLRGAVGDDFANWMQERLLGDRGFITPGQILDSIAETVQAGALGGIGSGFWNLMQNIPAAAQIGEYQAKGMGRVMKSISKYTRFREQGLNHERAMLKAMPLLKRSGLVIDPTTREMMQAGIREAYEMGSTMGRTLREKINSISMIFFNATENSTRAATLYGAFELGRKSGFKVKEALEFARNQVNDLVFLSGGMSSPALVADWHPLFRQFMTFTTRSAEWLTQKAAAGDWGTVGRLMALSSLTLHSARQLNMNVEQGLYPSTLPINTRYDSPTGLIPTPPIFSTALGIAQDIMEGKVDRTLRSAQLLIPGGLALGRLSTVVGPMFAPDVAPNVLSAMGKEYVDYRQKSPDGRYAVYDDGGSLKGYHTGWDLFLRATGIGGGGYDKQLEVELMQNITARRDIIRDYRRQLIDAITQNDAREIQKVQSQYELEFPGLGGLQISPKDLEAANLRREIPRIELMLDTLPEPARKDAIQAIQTALMASSSNFLEMDPAMLSAGPTSKSRRKMPNPTGRQPASIRPPFNQQTLDARNPQLTNFSGFQPFTSPE